MGPKASVDLNRMLNNETERMISLDNLRLQYESSCEYVQKIFTTIFHIELDVIFFYSLIFAWVKDTTEHFVQYSILSFVDRHNRLRTHTLNPMIPQHGNCSKDMITARFMRCFTQKHTHKQPSPFVLLHFAPFTNRINLIENCWKYRLNEMKWTKKVLCAPVYQMWSVQFILPFDR